MPYLIDPFKVGAKIKGLLKENNMTQEKLANKLFISKSAVSQNLNGRSSFDIQNLIKISQIFNISLDELLELSSTKLDELSIYEKLIDKDLEWFMETNVKELVINKPDVYGKVLVEYIINNNKLDLFSYLDNSALSFVEDVNHRNKEIYLMIIKYMLQNNLNPIKYIKKYVAVNYSFSIEDEVLEEAIWLLINKSNNLDLLNELLNGEVKVDSKVLFINTKKKQPLINLKAALAIQTKYKLDNVLSFLIEKLKEKNYYNYYQIIEDMIIVKYYDGVITFNNKLFQDKDISSFMKVFLGFSKAIELAIQTKDIGLIKSFINNDLYTNINKVVELLVENELFELVESIISDDTFDLNFKLIGNKIIEKNKNDLLSLIVEKSDQNTLNYLLSRVDSDNLEAIKMLVAKDAKYNVDNYNSKTFDKINNIIKSLIRKEK